MTLKQFEKALREFAPEEFDPALHLGIEIYFSDGHCSVKYGDQFIGNANTEEGWDCALEQAVSWLITHVKETV